MCQTMLQHCFVEKYASNRFSGVFGEITYMFFSEYVRIREFAALFTFIQKRNHLRARFLCRNWYLGPVELIFMEYLF